MAGAVPDSSKIDGNAPAISTALCITLAVVILIGVCIARKTNTLGTLQEAAARTRSSFRRRGLDNETIESIPITQYHYSQQRPPSAEHQFDSTTTPNRKDITSRLETILEDGTADQPSTESEAKKGSHAWVGAILGRVRTLVPKQPRPHLRKPRSDLARQDSSCSICTEDFIEGIDLRKLPCGHLYHPQCIDQWLRDFGVTCPLW